MVLDTFYHRAYNIHIYKYVFMLACWLTDCFAQTNQPTEFLLQNLKYYKTVEEEEEEKAKSAKEMSAHTENSFSEPNCPFRKCYIIVCVCVFVSYGLLAGKANI